MQRELNYSNSFNSTIIMERLLHEKLNEKNITYNSIDLLFELIHDYNISQYEFLLYHSN